jgi:hypothetical protein
MFHGVFRLTLRLASATKFETHFLSTLSLLTWCIKLRGGVLGNLFRPDTYLTSASGAGNNWAKGCE